MKILFVLAICTYAWAQIDQPQIGKMLDANGAIRTVYGITASVTLGDAELTGVLSSACGKTFCLAKTDTSIVSSSGTVDAPAGPALFAFNGDTAYVWFSHSRQLAQWKNGALTLMDATIDGEVLSIRARAGSPEFAVRTPSGEWIIKPDGTVLDPLPRATGPVVLIPDGVVYATREELVIRDVRMPLEHVSKIFPLSDGYLQVRAGRVDYALRIEKGRETLFQLPGVPQ